MSQWEPERGDPYLIPIGYLSQNPERSAGLSSSGCGEAALPLSLQPCAAASGTPPHYKVQLQVLVLLGQSARNGRSKPLASEYRKVMEIV